MKKLLMFSCLLIFLFSFKQNFSSNKYSKDTTSESLILKNGDLSNLMNPLELTGEFQVWKNKSGEVVFYTETDSGIFLFSCQDCNIDLNLINPKEDGTLTYLDHAFVFKNKNGSFYFAVDKTEEKLIKSSFNLSFEKENENYGNGIVKSFFNKDIEIQYPNFNAEVLKSSELSEYFLSIFGTTAICQSGGEGSTSCSISSCSVSCGDGYYACCNPGNCNCTKNHLVLLIIKK